jgi:hypothetical protein
MSIGLTDDGDAYFSGEIKVGETNGVPNFHVDKEGNVELNGNITWGASASPAFVVYNQIGSVAVPNKTAFSAFPEDYDADILSGWHTYFNQESDIYAAYTADGGQTWTNPVRLVGQDGQPGTQYTIGDDGYWYADGTKTSTKAEAEDGTPVTIVGVYYAAHSSKDVAPNSYGENGVYPTDISKDKPYLWTKTEFSSGEPVITVS